SCEQGKVAALTQVLEHPISSAKRLMPLRPYRILFSLLFALPVASGAASAAPTLMRFPSSSATQVAFVAHGDLWSAPRDGGRATRLVKSDGQLEAARFSPDGRWIAYTRRARGGQDVFIVAADGGEPHRLTFDART